MFDRTAGERSPENEIILALLDDLGVPGYAQSKRGARFPMGAAIALRFNRAQMAHKARQIFEISPKTENLFDRLVDGETPLHGDRTGCLVRFSESLVRQQSSGCSHCSTRP